MIDNNLMLGEAIYLRRILNIFFLFTWTEQIRALKKQYFFTPPSLIFLLSFILIN